MLSAILLISFSQLRRVSIDYAKVSASRGYSVPTNLVRQDDKRAFMDCMTAEGSKDGRTQTVTVQSSAEVFRLSVRPNYELYIAWQPHPNEPDSVVAEVAVDEAAYGPPGSTASVGFGAGPVPKANGTQGVLVPLERFSHRPVFKRVATNTFSVPMAHLPGSTIGRLPFNLGALSVS